ncbi:aromatic amino acid lyase, partial [Streptomyces recifensis]|uniref:aromatic amino acid lyase n=1 Tax=Streptomyces recifensis TaxID=67355 RepID=UPI001FC97D45
MHEGQRAYAQGLFERPEQPGVHPAAGGTGAPLPDDAVRAVMAVRLNQLAAAGSGVHPRLLRAL